MDYDILKELERLRYRIECLEVQVGELKAAEASAAYAKSWDLHPYIPSPEETLDDKMHNPNGNEIG